MFDADEILTNSHAGMLNDSHRHNSYKSAICNSVQRHHLSGKIVNLLDIGTGTGLLALFAAHVGAENIVACESNETMVSIAKEVFSRNRSYHQCNIVIESGSSLMLNTANAEYTNHFNIIVSEVYDSELIGEGCLETYQHALTHLATKDCIFIPNRATLFAQPIFSWSLLDYYTIKNNDTFVCIDFTSPWEIHTDKCKDIELGENVELFKWDFNQKSVESWTGEKDIFINNNRHCCGLLVWWESYIDKDNTICTAPSPHFKFQEFRDHWMPLLYFLCPQTTDFVINVAVCKFEINITLTEKSKCSCIRKSDEFTRNMLPRYLGYMNNKNLDNHYFDQITDILSYKYGSSKNALIVYYGPPSILPQSISYKIGEKVTVLDSLDLAEPHYSVLITSCYDPDCLTSLSYYYKRRQLEQSITPYTTLVPSKVLLFVTLIESSQLRDKTIPPDNIDGIDISSFSEKVRQCILQQSGEDMFEPIHLWEYEYTNLTNQFELTSVPFLKSDAVSLSITVTESGKITNLIFSLGFMFGESILYFNDRDYFNKVDCFTCVDEVEVTVGDIIQLNIDFEENQIDSLSVEKLIQA